MLHCTVLSDVNWYLKMATFFGEVMPVLSRAVDEDDEENDGEIDSRDSRQVLLRWTPELRQEIHDSSDGRLHCRKLIFAVSWIARAFVRRCLISEDAVPVGVISCGLDAADRNTVTQQAPDDSSCFLYRVTAEYDGDDQPLTSIVCVWNLRATPFQEFSAVNQLFGTLSSVGLDVVILTNSHVSNYKRTGYDDCHSPVFVRSLMTDHRSRKSPFTELEVPNIVSGTPAAVMSHCQVYGISAIVCVCYSEDLRSISENIAVFEPLLSASHHDKHSKIPSNSSLFVSPLNVPSQRNLHI